jgi:uncharacterized protein DUF4199
MKIPLTYGGLIALASAVVFLVLFFLGFHSDPAKIQMAGIIAGSLSLVISTTGITLGTRARRSEISPGEGFSYGRAFGTGLSIGAIAAFFSSIFQVIYVTLINPSYTDVMSQQQAMAMEAKGVPPEQIEKIQKFSHIFTHPAVQFIFALFFGILFAVVIALIVAAFLKRSANNQALNQQGVPPLPGV